MSLEQVIEQDIVRFLEGETKTEHTTVVPRFEDAALAYLNKDYEKETKAALKKNDVEQAKRLYNELKHNYELTPQDHELIRKHLYSVLQVCYIEIINFLQDRMRTNILLQQMEQSPEDVFDVHIHPINLQQVQQQPRKQIPELPRLTKEMLTADHKHPLAEQHQITLPSAPAAEAPQPPPTQPAQSAPVLPALHQANNAFFKTFKETAARILDIGKADHKHAEQLLTQLREQAQQAHLTAEQTKTVNEKLDLLEAALHAHSDKKQFLTQTNAQLTEIARLGRQHDKRALEELTTVIRNVHAFETKYPVYKGLFEHHIQRLKEQFGLYDEDELVTQLTPHIQALKTALQNKDLKATEHVVQQLKHFTAALPRTRERELLEAITDRITAQLEHRTDEKLQVIVERVHAAVQTKNSAAYNVAVDSLAQYASTLKDNERAAVLAMVAHLRANAPVHPHA